MFVFIFKVELGKDYLMKWGNGYWVLKFFSLVKLEENIIMDILKYFF